MSEEEKEAIERVENNFYKDLGKGISKFQKITLYEDDITDIRTLLNLIYRLQKELEQEKEKNNRQLEIDTAEEVLKWKGKYHLLSRKINGVLEDKIKDKIKEFEKPLLDIAEEQKFDFNYTLDGLSAISKAIPKVLEDILKEN